MATEVAVINASSGVSTFYSTYAAARSAASSGDTIQIWADLTDEQILLKDGVDLWFAPGRIIETSQGYPLIIDNDGVYTSPVAANLTGNAIFRNSNDKYRCVLISNSDSKISIHCDSLEATGTDPDETEYATVHLDNASKFYLTCNKISSTNQRAIYFANEVGDININANLIENGEFIGGDAITTRGTGFLTANEVISKSDGSCLSHKAGTLTANILKLTTIDSEIETAATVQLSDGAGTQNLILYFDEIQNSSTGGGDAVKSLEGMLNLIGRRIYSTTGMSMDLAADANVVVDEIISNYKGINVHNGITDKIIIDSNYIEGGSGHFGVVYCNETANLTLRNAKIVNTTTTTSDPFSIGIFIENVDPPQTITIENLIIVTGTNEDDFSIYTNGFNDVFIQNLGLFVKKDVSEHISLFVGDESNFKYIENSDIT